MNSRRNFLLKGTMATSALLVAKPFNSIAHTLAPVTGFSLPDNKVIFLHTGNHPVKNIGVTIDRINSFKKNTGNLVLLHAGHINDSPSPEVKYDVSIPEAGIGTDDYKIMYKGNNIKIGVIHAVPGQKDIDKTANTLAAWLKNEKNCHLVVCLSQLGYKTKTSIDDLQLANNSTHIDIIISGHAGNFNARPVITLNRKKAEVIIHASAAKDLALGNVEINFDEKNCKKFIAFNNLFSNKAGKA